MSTENAYNTWSTQYDTNKNRTRDLEAYALRSILDSLSFDRCLEIGCGTGKNTVWLAQKAKHITAVDFSEGMLLKAREKITSSNVHFVRADIRDTWDFPEKFYDLVTFSLVLEHIRELEPVLQKASSVLQQGGHIYIGELHPFKQYSGSKARFETEEGVTVVECFNHHVSDFIKAAKASELEVVELMEHFDEDDPLSIPRILCLLLRKK